jgi:hypothetical protein
MNKQPGILRGTCMSPLYREGTFIEIEWHEYQQDIEQFLGHYVAVQFERDGETLVCSGILEERITTKECNILRLINLREDDHAPIQHLLEDKVIKIGVINRLERKKRNG